MSAGENISTSERAIYLGKFVGTILPKMDQRQGIGELEKVISQYVKLEGRYTGVGVVEERDLKKWKYTLDTYDKVSRIIYNLENTYPDAKKTLDSFFDLKMIKIYLAAVIIRGSKLFKEIEDKNKITIDRDKLLEEDKQFRQEHFKFIEDFLRSPMPFVNENEKDEPFFNGREIPAQKERFFEKGEIVYWYLIYYQALIEREKEMLGEKGLNPEISKREETIKSMMNEFAQRTKTRHFEQRDR